MQGTARSQKHRRTARWRFRILQGVFKRRKGFGYSEGIGFERSRKGGLFGAMSAVAPAKGTLAASEGGGGGVDPGGAGTAATGGLIAVDWLVWFAAVDGGADVAAADVVAVVAGGGGGGSVLAENRMREPSNAVNTILTVPAAPPAAPSTATPPF